MASSSSAPPCHTPPASMSRTVEAALVVCAVGLAGVTFLPSLVRIEIDPHWGWNPQAAELAEAMSAMGPTAVAWLNVVGMILAAITIGLHAVAGGAIAWRGSGLILLGMFFAARHMTSHADNLRLCGSWMAAAAVAMAVVHLVHHDAPRRLLLAVTLALLVPMFVDAASYVGIEHPVTVADYQQRGGTIIADRGFELGSVQQRLFEERLFKADAVGAYGLSNVFGSIVAALTAAVALLGVGAWRRGDRVPGGMALLLAILGLATVAMTRSKGAAIACLVVLAFATVVGPLTRWRAGAAVVMTLALVVVVVVGVVLRGMLGPPPDASGERSLLFRCHYWQAAAAMVFEGNTTEIMGGRGPAAFGRYYPRYKPPLNPEQVSSSHSVTIDAIVMLGVGGVAWLAVLLGWLVTATRRVTELVGPTDEPAAPERRPWQVDLGNLGTILLIAVPMFAIQYAVQRFEMDYSGSLRWLAGVAGFVFAAAVFLADSTVQRRVEVGCLWAAALVLMVHGQIEMTFFSESAARVAWFLMAMAAAPSVARFGGARTTMHAIPVVVLLVAFACFLAVVAAMPTTRQETHLAAAAEALRSEDEASVRRELAAAVAALPTNPRPYKTLARLAVAQNNLETAMDWITRARAAGVGGTWCHRLRLTMVERAAVARVDLDPIIEELLVASPHNPHDRLHVADALWSVQRKAMAAEHYRAALRLSDQASLDPQRQLTVKQVKQIRERLSLE